MKIYLASRYSRREELCRYRTLLEAAGHTVTARWLNGKHQIANDGTPIDDAGETLVEQGGAGADVLRTLFALEDLNDVFRCDLLIAFTEPARAGPTRGGRHVELGIALGLGKHVIVAGHRENLFCWLPAVEFHESPLSAIETLVMEAVNA